MHEDLSISFDCMNFLWYDYYYLKLAFPKTIVHTQDIGILGFELYCRMTEWITEWVNLWGQSWHFHQPRRFYKTINSRLVNQKQNKPLWISFPDSSLCCTSDKTYPQLQCCWCSIEYLLQIGHLKKSFNIFVLLEISSTERVSIATINSEIYVARISKIPLTMNSNWVILSNRTFAKEPASAWKQNSIYSRNDSNQLSWIELCPPYICNFQQHS